MMKIFAAILITFSSLAASGCSRHISGIHVEKMANLDYPIKAHLKNIQGTVQVHISIGPDGTVLAARAVGGDPWLQEAAVENVKKWFSAPSRLTARSRSSTRSLTNSS